MKELKKHINQMNDLAKSVRHPDFSPTVDRIRSEKLKEKKDNRSSIIRDVSLIVAGIVLTYLFNLAIDIYTK